MKRHSYDIYDSDVMKAAVSKLQTSLTTLETSQASGADKAGKQEMCRAMQGNSLSKVEFVSFDSFTRSC